jgi:D-galactarolactone cycloisomerase
VVGGFTAARRIGALTQAANLQCMPHVWGSAILFVASLHLAAALPNCPIFEFRQGPCGYFTDLIEETPAIDENGCVTCRIGQGWALRLTWQRRSASFRLNRGKGRRAEICHRLTQIGY